MSKPKKQQRKKTVSPTSYRWPTSKPELKKRADTWAKANERPLSYLITHALEKFFNETSF